MDIIGQQFELGVGIKDELSIVVLDKFENPRRVALGNGNDLQYSVEVKDIVRMEGDLYYKFLVYKLEKFIGISFIEKKELAKLGLKKIGHA